MAHIAEAEASADRTAYLTIRGLCQLVRTTRNLPLAQRQAGWSRLQMAYLTVGDEEARKLMRDVLELDDSCGWGLPISTALEDLGSGRSLLHSHLCEATR